MNEALEQVDAMREIVDEYLSLGNVDYKYAKRYENEWLEKAPKQLAEKLDELRYMIEFHMEQNEKLENVVEMKVSA